jgi:hypothetical protein
MRRGELRLVELDPAPGSEADKRRPLVLLRAEVSGLRVEGTAQKRNRVNPPGSADATTVAERGWIR